MLKKVILGILAIGLVATSCGDDDNNTPDELSAGELKGGPFNFCIDGEEDLVSDITIEGSNPGESSTWVVTDAEGQILGLPGTLEMLEANNFDGAGAGTCLIWYLTFNGELIGAEMGANAADLEGDFKLSNSIEVIRSKPEAGTITGGPFNFTAGDGMPDFVSDIATDGMGVGTNSTWVVTDDQGNILGLPPTLEDLEGNDFDGAGAGTCLIWYLRFEDGLQNAEMGKNASELMGCFDLSNSIEVVRSN